MIYKPYFDGNVLVSEPLIVQQLEVIMPYITIFGICFTVFIILAFFYFIIFK